MRSQCHLPITAWLSTGATGSLLDTLHKNKEMGTFPEVTAWMLKDYCFLMCELFRARPIAHPATELLSKAVLGEENLGLVGTGSGHEIREVLPRGFYRKADH